ncbi:MAG: signal peptidase I [Nitrospirae bacterium]|nr:signal peptidase I [Nitrospirota bacterium]
MEKKRSLIREYIEAIAIAILLALVIRTFIIQAFKIPSGSMIPTLDIGDHILVSKFIYGIRIPYTDIKLLDFKKPNRGDIIVFIYPEDEKKDFIKRVIGVPGDKIEIKNKEVYVNGEKFTENYIVHHDPLTKPKEYEPRDNTGSIIVPPDSLFVMGDNRDQSYDSRYWGFVKMSKVKGRAFIIYWSWDGKDTWVRWWRIGKIIR